MVKDIDIDLFRQKLTKKVEQLKQENITYNLPEFYKDSSCTEKSYFIAQYPTGDKTLVKVSTETGNITPLKKI